MGRVFAVDALSDIGVINRWWSGWPWARLSPAISVVS